MSFTIPKLSIPTIFQHKPSAKLGTTSVASAPAKNGDRASHGALYNSKRGLTIGHKDRKHIDATAESEISDIDHEIQIQAAFGDPKDKASSIAKILTKLLEQPCFQPSEHIPNEEMGKPSADLGRQRGAAQKTALETFKKVFPLTISDDKSHLTVLKKLIDTLPNLEHHATIEQNPQLRGISVLKEALGSLLPNDVAEILVHQMDGIPNLRNERSRHKVISKGSAGSLLINARKTAAFVFAPSPLNRVVLAPYEAAANESRAIKSQPQGAALYMLKDQLTKLRKDWATVTPDNKKNLITAFKELKNSNDDIFGTKQSNLRRHYSDKKVDPSKF